MVVVAGMVDELLLWAINTDPLTLTILRQTSSACGMLIGWLSETKRNQTTMPVSKAASSEANDQAMPFTTHETKGFMQADGYLTCASTFVSSRIFACSCIVKPR